ncbi:protein of unknown function [Cupriavidus taiwanensis]|nr:protein of unknown function [Cupriavidus taiwanensis]
MGGYQSDPSRPVEEFGQGPDGHRKQGTQGTEAIFPARQAGLPAPDQRNPALDGVCAGRGAWLALRLAPRRETLHAGPAWHRSFCENW